MLKFPAVAVALAALLPFARGQGDDQSNPAREGLQILKEADTAVTLLQGFRYKARARAEGGVRSFFPQMEGEVTGTRARGDEPAKFRIERSDPAMPQRIICDGKEVYVSEGLGRRWIKRPAAEIERLDTYNLVFLREYTLPRPFEEELFRSKVSYARTEKFDGVVCKVVEAKFRDGQWVEWTIGAEDHLPRRVRRGFREGAVTSGFVLELNDLRRVPQFAPGHFQMPTALENGRKALPTGWRVADWKLECSDGKEITSAALRRRVVVLDFWSVGCLACRQNMLELQGLKNQFRDKPVSIIGVNAFDQPENNPQAFMADNGYTYDLCLKGDALAGSFLVEQPPGTYVISPDGRVLAATFDADSDDALTEAIRRGLEQLEPVVVPATNPAAR